MTILALGAMALPGIAFADSPLPLAAALAKPGAITEAEHLDKLPPVPAPDRIEVDHSGRKEAGEASIYSHSFDGRKMADGRRYNPHAEIAASKSLPLGTTAKVTNLENGKSIEVKVEDRGPFVNGRVVDLTPRAASRLGLTRKVGLAPVIVAPITIPLPNGGVKVGAGAAEIPAGKSLLKRGGEEEASNRAPPE